MSKYTLLISPLIVLAACGKTKTTNNVIPAEPQLSGGKGGPYSMAVFTKQGTRYVGARVFIKYAAEKAPADTGKYDERSTAVAEPGYGNHVHFKELRTGSYFIHAAYTAATADTVIKLTDASDTEVDLTLNLK